MSDDLGKTIKIKNKKSFGIKKYAKLCKLLVVIAISVGTTYYFCKVELDKQNSKHDSDIATLEKVIKSLHQKLADNGLDSTETIQDQKQCVSKTPSVTAIENIEASIASGNTAALEGYMASKVSVVLAASESGGSVDAAGAIASIASFIKTAGIPWNFDLQSLILSSYQSGDYGQYFLDNSLVGKSTDEKVISFSFDCNAKISKVFMSASSEILD